MNRKIPQPTSLIPKRRRMKCQRNIPVLHSEVKQTRSLALTDTAVSYARDFGNICEISSISESVEIALRLVGQLRIYFQLEELKLMIRNMELEEAAEAIRKEFQ